ncbi:uncharacterized protein [Palaemon carinicauda]|uniref:uncharacterized protein n=1 Tax=Palaemon carinicauda TaxID=392227 RepID=UPI0035B6032C
MLSRDNDLHSSSLATDKPSAWKITSHSPSDSSGVSSLGTTGNGAQARRSEQFAAADSTLQSTASPSSRPDNTLLPTAPTAEDLTMLGRRDSQQDFSVSPTFKDQITTTSCSHGSHIEHTNHTSQPNPTPSRPATPEPYSPPRLS